MFSCPRPVLAARNQPGPLEAIPHSLILILIVINFNLLLNHLRGYAVIFVELLSSLALWTLKDDAQLILSSGSATSSTSTTTEPTWASKQKGCTERERAVEQNPNGKKAQSFLPE